MACSAVSTAKMASLGGKVVALTGFFHFFHHTYPNCTSRRGPVAGAVNKIRRRCWQSCSGTGARSACRDGVTGNCRAIEYALSPANRRTGAGIVDTVHTVKRSVGRLRAGIKRWLDVPVPSVGQIVQAQ